MMSAGDEFSPGSVQSHQLVAWPRVAAVAAMVAFSLPTFVTGLTIADGLPANLFLWAFLIGCLITTAVGMCMGAIGSRTRLSSYLLVRIAFGDRGAGVVNLAFAVSLLGWYGVNINLFTGAVDRLARSLFDQQFSPIVLAVGASICMTVTCLIGFRAINLISVLLVPVLVAVTFLLARFAVAEHSVSDIVGMEKAATASLGDSVSAIVGAVVIGAIILPDITRFCRHWSGALHTALISYLLVQMVVLSAAGLAGTVTGETDILQLMLDASLGFGAFAIVIIGSWVLNSLNLYSAVLGVKATFPRLNTFALTITLGVIGVAAALMNILDHFITFLFYLSVIFIPVAGVIIVDYFLIRSETYRDPEALTRNAALNIKGLIAWAAGAVAALLMEEGLVPSLSRIAAIDAVALAALVYFALSFRSRQTQVQT